MNTKRNFLRVISSLTLTSFFFVQGAFAAPPGSLYLPGETNAPTCAPGDANCDVDLASIDDQILTLSGSELIISDGNSVDLSVLQGTSSLSGATDTTFSTLGTGSILYFDGSGWIDLVVGGVGQKLTSGTGGVLSWESDSVSMSGTGSFSGSGTSSRIGEFVFAKSGRQVSDGYLAVNPGTITDGATDYPIWAAMYPEFVSGNDIVFPSNVGGMFLRNLGGNATTEGTFQNDATAINGLRIRTEVVYSGQSSEENNTVAKGTVGGNVSQALRDAPLSGDTETRPFNRAYQLYTIVDTYGDGDTTPAMAGLSDTDTTGASTGSLLYNDGSGWIDLDVGAQDQVLTSSGGTLVWGVASGGTSTLSGATDTNLTSQAAGSLLYFDGTEWIDLDAGVPGQKLVAGTGGLLSWETDSTTSVDLHRVFISRSYNTTGDQGVNTNDLSYAGSSVVDLDLGTAITNVGGVYSTGTDSMTITQDGTYQIKFTLNPNDSGGAANRSSASIGINGSGVSTFQQSHSAGFTQVLIAEHTAALSAGDVIDFRVGSDANQQVDISGFTVGLSQLPTTAGVGVGGAGGSADLDGLTDTNLTSQAAGSLLYFDGTEWIDLDAGTPGQKLVVGTGGVLEWVTDAAQTPLAHGYWYTDGTGAAITATAGSNIAFASNIVEQFNQGGITFNGITWTLPAGRYKLSMDLQDQNGTNAPIYQFHDGTSFIGNRGQSAAQGANFGGEVMAVAYVESSSTINITARATSNFTVAANNANVASFVEIQQLPITAGVGVGGGATTFDELTDTNDQATSGYMDIGDMRIQWGTAPSGTVTFPAPFADTSYSFVGSSEADAGTSVDRTVTWSNKTTTTITMTSFDQSTFATVGNASWQAIGLKP